MTGHPARYIDTDFETYWKSAPLSAVGDRSTGYNPGFDNVGSNVGKVLVLEIFTGVRTCGVARVRIRALYGGTIHYWMRSSLVESRVLKSGFGGKTNESYGKG